MTTILLFEAGTSLFLGEFRFQDDVLVEMMLSAEGEAHLGKELEHWFQEGITVLRFQEQCEKNTFRLALREEHVSPKSQEAYAAFTEWAQNHRLSIISLPERLVPHWHRLIKLHLEPKEQFMSMQAMRQAPHRLLAAWDHALNQVLAHT